MKNSRKKLRQMTVNRKDQNDDEDESFIHAIENKL